MWTEQIEQEYLDIFRSLLRFNSANPPGFEREIAEYIHEKLTAEHIESYIVGRTLERANVLARIVGKNHEKKPLRLISHIDVVPAEGWSVPAFEAYERDGAIYGRGTLDTKQLTAGQLMAMLLLKRCGLTPQRDVIFIASADEENGSGYGMEYLTKTYPEWFRPAYTWSEGGGFIVRDGRRTFRLCAGSEKSTLNIRIAVKAGRGGEWLEEQTLYRVAHVLERLASYVPKTTLVEATKRFYKVADPDRMQDTTIRNLWEYSTKCSMQVEKFNFQNMERQDVGAELRVNLKLLPGMRREEGEALFETLLQGEPVMWEVTGFQSGYESSFENEFLNKLDTVSKRLDPGTEMLPILILGSTDGRFIGGDVYGYTPALEDTPFSEVLQMVHGKDEHLSLASAVYNGRVIGETVLEFACDTD